MIPVLTRPDFVFNEKEGLFDSPLNPLLKFLIFLIFSLKTVFDKMRTNNPTDFMQFFL